MKPFSQFPSKAGRNIRVVLFDIDDTLTTEGKLTAPAYDALARLQAAGILTIPITGRPAGWCDHIARMWPVDGVVGENGAFYFRYDATGKKMQRRFVKSAIERTADRARLDAIATHILKAVPGCTLASDQPYREADIAIDFCEDVPPLSHENIERIRSLMSEAGLNAKVSSIHVNGWFGGYDKLSTTRLFCREVLNLDIDTHKDQCLFVGDSPNDQPMFGFFPHSVGVANVKNFMADLRTPPAWVTEAESGAGWVELVNRLLEASD